MTIEFKPGDKVKKKSGEPFSNGGALEATVDHIEAHYMVYLLETGTWIGAERIEKVENDMTEFKPDRPDSEHYTDSGIDVWQFADANFDYDELFGFHRINAIKYLTRFGKKEGRNIRDLEKAEAIIKEMIRMEKEGE